MPAARPIPALISVRNPEHGRRGHHQQRHRHHHHVLGARQVRRYALTCERFGAEEARRIGLVHEIVPAAGLAAAGERILTQLLENGRRAMAETKACVLANAAGGVGGGTLAGLIESHAAKRQSAEAAEGLASFAEKRAARWETVR